ncbi:MAG: tRNA (N(6)-L-threonylcarbamoyladenosine(37)-C(2))-methylthiotransferase MtaB [Chloroflexota bacterium]
MKVRLDFIGCRLNISEIESIGHQFRVAGHQIVGAGEQADLCVFNTCAVTHIASRTSRQKIRRLKRDNPNASIIVTGCYADLEPDAVKALDIDLIVNNEEKDQLLDKAEMAGLIDTDNILPAPDAAFPLAHNRTRAFVKVQDGCDNRCTFCIVTVARGAGRSRTIKDVVNEVKKLVTAGYQEAVLTGVHLGSFGHDKGNHSGLKDLVSAILAETDIARLRLSSLEPWDLAPNFFDLWQHNRLCPHLHLPLQSGNDQTLKRMARRTSQAQFSALVQAARQAIPYLSITTDVIVGFPGETDAQFADSLAFVDQMAFSGMHIFRYSPREGTSAFKMPNQISPQVSKERSHQMHQLSAKYERAFRQTAIGQTRPVLWETVEETPGGSLWSGLTDNYIRTSAFSMQPLQNKITPTVLTQLLPDAVSGQIEGETVPLTIALV